MGVKRIMLEEYASWQKPIIAIANEGTATKGSRYIVGAAPTGTFEGLSTHDIAWYDGTDWQTDTPEEGSKAYDLDQNGVLSFNGTSWVLQEDVNEKIDKVAAAEEDNLASFDNAGNVKDSGVSTPTFDAELGCILMEFAD